MANFSWDRWYLYGSGWTTSYYGNGSVSVTRSAGSDTARVQATVYMWSYGGDSVGWTMHMSIGSSKYTVNISGSHVADYGAYSTSNRYYFTFDKNVSVGADSGSLTVKFWMTIDGYESYSGGTSTTKTATLTYDSKGASTITSAANRTLGNACSVTWTPYASNFKYKLQFSLGDWSHTTGYISPATTSAYTYTGYTLPLAVPSSGTDLVTQIPNSNKGTMTVKLFTYDASNNRIGSASSKTFTVTVPSDASTIPVINSVTLSGQDTSFNEFCVGLSKLTAVVSTSGTRGSTVKTAIVTIGNNSYSGTISSNAVTITSPLLTESGTLSVVTTITDSRGLTATNSQQVIIYNYSQPQITDFSLNISGTSVAISMSGTFSDVNSANTGKYYKLIRTKLSTSETTTIVAKTAISVYDWSTTYTQTVSDVETESYEYKLYLYDTKYSTDLTAITESAKTGIVCISRLAGGKGVAFFREATVADEGYVAVEGGIKSLGYPCPRLKTTTVASSTNSQGLIPLDLYIGNNQIVVAVHTTAAQTYAIYPVEACQSAQNDLYGRWYLAVESYNGTRASSGISLGTITVYYLEF